MDNETARHVSGPNPSFSDACHFEYDKVCKQRQELLKSTSALLDEVLSQGEISDANLRMLVKSVIIHQSEDKSIDVHFEKNGDFAGGTTIMWGPEFEVVG